MRPKQSTKRPKGSVRPNPSTLTSLIYPRRRSCPLFIAIHRRRRSRVHSPFIHVAILVSIAVLVPCLSILFFYAAVLVPHSCRQTFPFSLLILILADEHSFPTLSLSFLLFTHHAHCLPALVLLLLSCYLYSLLPLFPPLFLPFSCYLVIDLLVRGHRDICHPPFLISALRRARTFTD